MASSIRRTVSGFLMDRLVKSFGLFERLGLHVTPVHYFQPIPDTRRLDPRLWERTTEAVGVDFHEEDQLRLLRSFRERFAAEYRALPTAPTGDPTQFHFGNASFETVDAEVLYCTIRDQRPRRVIEIGSGFSTLVAAQAARKNAEEGAPCEIVAIEPYPNAVLSAGVPGVELRAVPLEAVPLAEFATLGENDILFIDSTHVLRIGGDVQYELLEIVPRLRPGVNVHVHDVFLPAEYPRRWVMENRWFWTEQYLLQAFLAFNDSFRITWGSGFMHVRHPDLLAEAFPSYRRPEIGPGSLWMRRER